MYIFKVGKTVKAEKEMVKVFSEYLNLKIHQNAAMVSQYGHEKRYKNI